MTINTTDNILLNSGNGNHFLQFRNTNKTTNGLFGLVGDNMIARISDSASFKVQSSAATDLLTINIAGALTCKGIDATGNSTFRGSDFTL